MLKRSIKNLLSGFLAIWTRIWSTRDEARDLVGIVPPAGIGSLGDEAMLTVLVDQLSKENEVVFLEYPGTTSWESSPKFSGVRYAKMPLGLRDYLKISSTMVLSEVYVVGADIIDGVYSAEQTRHRLDYCRFAALSGSKVMITGFSVSENIPDEIRSLLHKLPRAVQVGARDPLSLQRLGAIMRGTVGLVADLAFQLQPELKTSADRNTAQSLAAIDHDRRLCIGLCPSIQVLPHSDLPDDEKARIVIDTFIGVIEAVLRIDSEAFFVLLHHDYRGEYSDLAMAKGIYRDAGSLQGHLEFQDAQYSPEGIKYNCSALNLVISGRMHCGIAALGAGTPCVFLDYNDKSEGLLQYFSLRSVVQLQDSPDINRDLLFEKVRPLLEENGKYTRLVRDSLPEVLRLSKQNWHL